MTPTLDIVVENADIVTMDPRRPRATRVGVLHGRVVAIDEEVDAWAVRERLDAGGACLLPGLIDAHTHLQLTGQGLASVRIDECASAAAALATIEAAAVAAERDGWIEVFGYDHRVLGRHLTADELHRAAGGRRVWVKHVSSHASVVSTEVLERAPGAASHHSDGLLFELEQELVREQRLPYADEELVTALRASIGAAAREGITTCVEAGAGGVLGSLSQVDGGVFQDVLAHEPMRVHLMPSADVFHEVRTHDDAGWARALDLGLRTGFGSDRLRLSAQKTVLDGGMSVGTARMTEPMCGSEGHGVWREDPAKMAERMVDAHVAGWQLAVHAIGDAALDLALDAIERGQRRRPRPDARHRVEHGGAIRDDQLPRLAALGVTVVSQPAFVWHWGDDYADLLGPDRETWLYRGRSLLDAGVRVVGSTDRPLAGTPLQAIQTWADRRTVTGREICPEDATTVLEALEAFTVHGAWVTHQEDRLGRIRDGFLADFCLLAKNPLTTPVPEIADIEVLATAVEGSVTWHETLR